MNSPPLIRRVRFAAPRGKCGPSVREVPLAWPREAGPRSNPAPLAALALLLALVGQAGRYNRHCVASRTQLLVLSLGRRLSQQVKESVLAVQDYVLLTARGLAALVTPPRYQRELVTQMDSIGVQSLSIVVLTGMFTGMVLALQSAASLDAFGARPYVGRLVCISMVRELGPVLTALMVTGRVGSGMAAELGSMVVTQQIDALRVLGSDPVRKLVAPRLGAALNRSGTPWSSTTS